MPTTVLVISDLHLAGGDPALENWGDAQQAALESLLVATRPGGDLADDQVELVIAGDCFDFLLAQPELGARLTTDVTKAHAKWAAIAGAHPAWLAALGDFTRLPGRRVTFLIGNHDLELAYPSIRARVRFAVAAAPGAVRFCLTQAYQPLPDVVIDHGCQYDPWNRIPAIWASSPYLSVPAQLETSDAVATVGPLALPWGSRYFYRVFLPVKRRFPYMDEMYPGLSVVRQIAALATLAPDLLRAIGPQITSLASVPAEALAGVPAGAEASATDLFAAALIDMQRVADEVMDAGASVSELSGEAQALYGVLANGDSDAALRAIFSAGDAPRLDRAGPPIAMPGDAAARLIVVGHDHVEGRWSLSPGHTLLDSGTWFPRYAMPAPEEWSPAWRAWVTDPLASPYPGRDGSRFTVAWLRSELGAATVGELIAWGGDTFVPMPDDGRL